MQVKDVMAKDAITVTRFATLTELLQRFSAFHLFPLVPVVEADNRLVGLVSFAHLMSALSPTHPRMLKGVPFLDEDKTDVFSAEITPQTGELLIADDIMEKEYVSIDQEASLEEAFALLKRHLKEELPVVDKAHRLVGIVGVFDIVRAVFREKGVLA